VVLARSFAMRSLATQCPIAHRIGGLVLVAPLGVATCTNVGPKLDGACYMKNVRVFLVGVNTLMLGHEWECAMETRFLHVMLKSYVEAVLVLLRHVCTSVI
jgi:hypothetical protein